MTPEQQAIQAVAQRIASVMERELMNISRDIARTSSSTADATKKSFDTMNSVLSRSTRDLSENIRSVAEVLDSQALRSAADHERQLFEKRLANQLMFGRDEKQHEDDLAKQRAQALHNAAMDAQASIEQAKEQRKRDEIEFSKQSKERRTARKKAEAAEAAARDEHLQQEIKRDKARLEAEAREQQVQHAKSMGMDTTVLAKEADAAKQRYDAEVEHTENLKKAFDESVATNKDIRDHQAAQARKFWDTDAKELNDLITTATQRAVELRTKADKEAADALRLGGNAFKRELDKLTDRVKKAVSAENIQAVGAGLIAAGAKGTVDVARASINNSMSMPVTDQFNIGATTGMSTPDFMNMTSEYRRSMLAAGGLSDSMEMLSKNSDVLKGDIASLADRTKFSMQTMEMFTNMGIKPSEVGMKRMAKMYGELHKVTGMTAEQFTSSMRDLMENEDMLQTMRMANTEQERDAISASVAARYTENRLRGISDEQTKAILKQQMKKANEKPLNRYQQAIKEAAYAGVMGVGGGSQHIQRAMKPMSQWTAEDFAQNQSFRSGLSESTNRGANGNFAQQLQTSALSDKLAPEAWNDSVNNTKLANPAAAGIAKENQNSSFGSPSGAVVTANNKLEQALGLLKSPIVQLVAGLAALGIASGLNTWALSKNTAALNANTAGKAGGGSSLLDTITSGKGKIGGIGPKIASVARSPVGLAAIAMAAGATIDAGAGALGVGGKDINSIQDDKNWAKMTTWEKTQSSIARTVETVSKVLFLDNMANEAAATRINNETQYLAAKEAAVKEDATINENTAIVVSEVGAAAAVTLDRAAKMTDGKNYVPINSAITTDKQALVDGDGNIQQNTPQSGSPDKKQTNIDLQLARMDKSNEYLKTVADGVPALIDIANKQLAVATMSEKEKEKNKDKIRREAGFSSSSYQYI